MSPSLYGPEKQMRRDNRCAQGANTSHGAGTAVLEEENRGLMKMLKEMEDDDVYLVVDTESNRLTMRQGTRSF
jgi:hypothetical protein